MKIEELLKIVVDNKASDLHLVTGVYPILRTHGRLNPVAGEGVLTAEKSRELVLALMVPGQKEKFLKEKELDFSVSLPGLARFRVNAYFQKGTAAAALRRIPSKVPTIDELKLPKGRKTKTGYYKEI